ncbi:MAG: hypothetical protein K9L68_13850 [Spirochaetales bacterium]|nr:hypothetical protein [Spirochaetales bacterium]
MIQDIKNIFTYNDSTGAKEQAVTDSAASASQLQFGSEDIGQGNPVRFYVMVTEDFAALTSLNIALQESSDDGSSDAYADVLSSGEIALADLKAGDIVFEAVVPKDVEKYLQAYFTVTGTTATAGKVVAGLSRR